MYKKNILKIKTPKCNHDACVKKKQIFFLWIKIKLKLKENVKNLNIESLYLKCIENCTFINFKKIIFYFILM